MTPSTKVTAAGLGGALAVLLVWVLGLVGADPPATVAAALTTLCSFAAGYLVKEPA